MLTIGDLAARTGLTAKAIRLYETQGLIQSPARSPAGYRLYPDDAIPVLAFIRQAQTLDLSLKEIKDILDLHRGGEQPCALVVGLLDQHLEDIDRRVADLQALRETLQQARERADQTGEPKASPAVCRIIEGVTTA
ncbi:heavy metal-responsive transcriptional regulator [Streptomyces sp. MBT62]|uniref:heavy metal-responsive transcriptional regulator n=1 Tax=Streptomyces sp. MBT62 TaxID=2800410 RepID=UPI00190AB288|nr:heavy metal-responsive transcriptional regulator [Streptomyces sp. MBT62]MBK3570966.1 heavy metal-responsive transcriptional regulator [Streptomyces sp. MBT62]